MTETQARNLHVLRSGRPHGGIRLDEAPGARCRTRNATTVKRCCRQIPQQRPGIAILICDNFCTAFFKGTPSGRAKPSGLRPMIANDARGHQATRREAVENSDGPAG